MQLQIVMRQGFQSVPLDDVAKPSALHKRIFPKAPLKLQRIKIKRTIPTTSFVPSYQLEENTEDGLLPIAPS